MIKVRLEASVLNTQHHSGVAKYTALLEHALKENTEVQLSISLTPSILAKIFNKLTYLKLSPPFDIFLQKVDLTIFPNFTHWTTFRSDKTATVIHDLTYLHYPELVESKNLEYLQRVIPRTIQESDIIITVSDVIKNELVSAFGIQPNRIVTTPIPPAAEFNIHSTTDVFSKFKIKTKNYLYFLGTMEPRKNLSLLLEAYDLLDQDIKNNLSLVIAGGNGWKAEATEKKLAEIIKKNPNVLRVGYIDQDDNVALFQNAAAAVIPSLYEGFGMPVLEAMAAGTPVICSDIPIFREVGGDACLYVNAHNSLHLRDAIIQLQDSTACNELIRRGRKNLLRFNWQDNVEKIRKSIQ